MSPLHLSFLGYKARILHPEYLFLLAAVAVATGLAVMALLRQNRTVREVVPARLLDRVVPGFSPPRRAVRLGSVLLSLWLFTLALSQPQCGTGSELARRMGVDVVVALDVSKSMLARDVRPSRIERARLELGDLIDRLRGDRFGLVVFAGTAFVQCPLTTDYAAAKLFLKAVDTSAMPVQGTDLARALLTSRKLLTTREGARSQVIVLLTDGEDHSAAAISVAEGLAEEGIRVFAVGLGSPSGEPIPEVARDGRVLGYKKDAAGNTVLSRLDEETLRSIADITGGIYVHAGVAGAGIPEIIAALDELEKSEFEARMTTRFEDRSALFMLPGFLALLLGTVLPSGRRRRDAPHRAAAPDAGARRAAVVLLLVSPLLGGAKLLESQHPAVARGNEAYDEGRYDDALAEYEAALEELGDPARRARVHYNQGTTHAAKGEVEAAKLAFQSALAGADTGLQAKDWYNLGTALLNHGDPQGAADALKRALRLDPGSREAKYNLELALRALREDPPPPESKEDSEAQDEQDEEEKQDQQNKNEQQKKNEEQQNEEDGSQSEEEQQAQGEKPDDAEGEDEEGEKGEQHAENQEEKDSEKGEKEKEEQAGRKDGEDDEKEAQNQPQPAPGQAGDEEGELARALPAQVDEQEAERILDALSQGEKPLQMQLFMLEDYEAPPRGEKDW